MNKTCDICGGPTGFRNRFRCQDGQICKKCYEIVSNNFTQTIAGKTLDELKRTYIKNAMPIEIGEKGFELTEKIGSYLLLDVKNHQFCLTSNRPITRSYKRPVIYPYSRLKKYYLISTPVFSLTELESLAKDRKRKQVIDKLIVRLDLGKINRDIEIIPSSVRTSSFAFRQSIKELKKLLKALDDIEDFNVKEK